MAKSPYTMPVIVLNMGAEMVYILNQRLQAQAIQEEKSKKVLQDVMKAMYSSLFVQELFKPQEMYTTAATKQIFEKLAHSSIMRLNKSSMDKLYDLMNMGFKRQIIMCSSPHQYLVVTLNHLESIKRLVDDPHVHELVQVAIDKSVAMYTSLSEAQLYSLKFALLRFLQDRRVKVSLFLQQELQNQDGALVLSVLPKLPRGVETPGTIRYYEDGSVVSTQNFSTTNNPDSYSSREPMDLTCKLGLNMYVKETPGAKEVPHPSEFADSYAIALRAMGPVGGGASSSSSGPAVAPSKASGSRSVTSPPAGAYSAAKQELSMLSNLLGLGGQSSAESKGGPVRGFRINLFPDASDDKDGEHGGYIRFEIDGAADAKSMSRYMEELDLDDEYDRESKAGAKGGQDDEDDLLALMDSAK